MIARGRRVGVVGDLRSRLDVGIALIVEVQPQVAIRVGGGRVQVQIAHRRRSGASAGVGRDPIDAAGHRVDVGGSGFVGTTPAASAERDDHDPGDHRGCKHAGDAVAEEQALSRASRLAPLGLQPCRAEALLFLLAGRHPARQGSGCVAAG